MGKKQLAELFTTLSITTPQKQHLNRDCTGREICDYKEVI